jgi:hypothetical protein
VLTRNLHEHWCHVDSADIVGALLAAEFLSSDQVTACLGSNAAVASALYGRIWVLSSLLAALTATTAWVDTRLGEQRRHQYACNGPLPGVEDGLGIVGVLMAGQPERFRRRCRGPNASMVADASGGDGVEIVGGWLG